MTITYAMTAIVLMIGLTLMLIDVSRKLETSTHHKISVILICTTIFYVASDCLFDASNYSRNGASIMTNNPEAEVLFTSCTFLSHSSNTGGAANNSKGKQTFRNCIFKGCYTEAGTGGAIHVNGEGSEEYIDNCRFISCKGQTNNPMVSSTSKHSGIQYLWCYLHGTGNG